MPDPLGVTGIISRLASRSICEISEASRGFTTTSGIRTYAVSEVSSCEYTSSLSASVTTPPGPTMLSSSLTISAVTGWNRLTAVTSPISLFTFPIISGTTSNKSPTMPKSATLKICASLSLLTAMMVSAVCMPARC